MTSPTEYARDLAIKGALSISNIEQDEVTITETKLLAEHWVDLLVSHLKGEEVPVALWVSHIARNPYQEVTVIDSGHDRNVLFTIPALFDRERELYPFEVTDKIGEIVNKVASKNNVIPNSGNGILVDNLVNTVAPPRTLKANLDKWQPFLDHYGVVIEGVNSEPVEKREDNVTLKVVDEGELDDDF